MFDISVDDPSEWPLEFIALKKIDSHLRCPICFEFFNIAMIVPSCSHNFCSLCIRKHISYKECCPTCNTSLVAGDLKCNRIVDQLVKNFKAIREKLIEILKLYNGHGLTQKTLSRLKDKKKNIGDENVNSADEFQYEGLPVFRDPSSQNKSRVESKKHCGDDDNIVIGDDGNCEMTSCPVCTKKVPLQKINRHLDTCLGQGEENTNTSMDSGPSSSSRVSTKRKRRETLSPTAKSPMRPIVLTASLNVLQDKELKAKASQYGLSLQGNRKQLIKRIEQYILLYNSQCDAINPMSVSMITKEVNKNERNLSIHGYTPGIVMDTHDRRCSKEEKADFCVKYANKHEEQYQKLIDEIKGRPHIQKSQKSGKMKNENECVTTDKNVVNNDKNELIEIDSSDPSNKETEESADHPKFGYVPNWFDTDLLNYSIDKQTTKPNGEVVKAKVEEKVATDKGVKRKSKKTKNVVKKKNNVQSGNITSYFTAGNKKGVKNNDVKDTETPCCSKTTSKKDNRHVFLIEDSDSQSDNDKTMHSTPQRSPPPRLHTTEDVEEVMEDSLSLLEEGEDSLSLLEEAEDSPSLLEEAEDSPSLLEEAEDSPSLLDAEVTEDPPELVEELKNDVCDAFNSTAFAAAADPESLAISDDLSPVLFKETSAKDYAPWRSRLRKSSTSRGNLEKEVERKDSLDSELSVEISNLVDKAIENPHVFSSDSEDDTSFMNHSILVQKILHNKRTRRETGEREENTESHNVIPAPPTDFCFSQAEF